MTEQPERPKRGAQAWEEARARVAERNKQAHKAGKQQREETERRRAEARQAEERRGMSELLRRHPSG